MKYSPETETSDIAEISDHRPGICEGRVAKKDALELITTVKPWLGGRLLETVTVVGRPGGVMHLQSDSRGPDGGLVRGVTLFDPSMRPEDPVEGTRFDNLMATLGRAASYDEVGTAAGLATTAEKRSAA